VRGLGGSQRANAGEGGGLRRWAVLVGAAALVAVVGGVAARGAPRGPVVQGPPALASGVLPAARGLGSTWFCPGGTGTTGGAAATVVVSDPEGPAVTGELTATSSTGRSRTVPLRVPAGQQVGIGLASLVPGPWVSATVTLDRAGVAVGETVAGAAGWAAGPCEASTASSWYLPPGSTAGGDQLLVAVADPTATTAVVDTTLLRAGSGRLSPSSLQGVSVPAHGVVVESLDEVDVGDASVAPVVSALSGTVVAAGVEVAEGGGTSGVALLDGVPRPARHWTVPMVTGEPAGSVTVPVVNPGPRTARVTVVARSGQGGEETGALAVGPGEQTLVPAGLLRAATVGGAGSLTVTSRNGQGVVVARRTNGSASFGAPQVGTVLGVPSRGATRWLLPAVEAPATAPIGLGLVDLGPAPAQVEVEGTAPGQATPSVLARLTVDPGTPLERLRTVPGDLGLVPTEVRASEPIVLEVDPGGVGIDGVSVLPAQPVLP
jgi:hypothetical protein